MKHLFLALLVGFSLTTCREREPDPNILPPATQSGANTAGCLVNGKVLVFARSKKDNFSPEESFYQPSMDGKSFRIKLYMGSIKNDVNKGRFDLFLRSDKRLELNKKYIVGDTTDIANKDFPSNNLLIGYRDNGYRTDNNYKCEIIFTKVTQGGIASGTFSGKLRGIRFPEKVIVITDGRFDIKL
ncbi:hypothetical protein [Riemerella columbina]|uniref:hypothetical protein n=1 Tax=Riemerella columbina TaxID=103810 RepID=UPI00266EB988|nr:hypothetical protein [Riemerella columbina]WKS95540.1 hypothetical protein NYR17_02030 [Riemerella columbina]